MTERKSPTAVLREGPRALSDDQVREIEDSALAEVLHVDIDDVIEYVHKDLKSLPDFTTLYRKYLKQRWDVYDLDFAQDQVDWREKMTEEERQSFIAVASGFHHGERQVEIELPVFMIGASEEEKLHIAAQIEDEARHTVFFDRFYREVVGLKGDDIMAVLDASFPWVSETFVAPFGLLAYQADELRLHPYDERARVRYGTTYFLWIEGVLALSVMKVTLSYARWRGFLPAYYTGFTATCRDESRHVQGGMRYLQDAVRKDPTMINEIHDTLRTILSVSGVVSRRVYYEPLGWTDDEVRVLFFQQLRRKLNDVGIGLSPDLEDLLQKVQPVVGRVGPGRAGGRASGAGAGGQAAGVLGLLRVHQERVPGVLGAGLPGPARPWPYRLPVRGVGRRHGDRLPDHRPGRAARGDLRARHGLPGLEGAARGVRRAAHGHVPQDPARGG